MCHFSNIQRLYPIPALHLNGGDIRCPLIHMYCELVKLITMINKAIKKSKNSTLRGDTHHILCNLFNNMSVVDIAV